MADVRERAPHQSTVGINRQTVPCGTLDSDFFVQQVHRRLEMLRVSTGTTADDIEHGDPEELAPTELDSLSV